MAEEQTKQPATKWDIALSGEGMALAPKNFEQALQFARMLAETDFVPKEFINKPGAVLAAIQYGAELGLTPMAALQSIAIVNGRPSLWGDGALAILKSNRACEWVHELPPDEAIRCGYGECTIKRKGDPEVVTRRFTKEMAEQAGLWGGKSQDPAKKKYEPWYLYPGRMLQMRARSWAMRDAIPEAFRGIQIREEVLDATDVTPPKEEAPKLEAPKRLSETKKKEEEQEKKDEGHKDSGTTEENLLQDSGGSVNANSTGLDAGARHVDQPAETESEKQPPGSGGVHKADPQTLVDKPILQQIKEWIDTAPAQEIFGVKNFATYNKAKVPDADKRMVDRWIEIRKAELRRDNPKLL